VKETYGVPAGSSRFLAYVRPSCFYGMVLAIQKERRNEGEGVYQVHSLRINAAFAVFQTRLPDA
jgi:hypothetical protein